jgi:type VI protein secretion system component VasK
MPHLQTLYEVALFVCFVIGLMGAVAVCPILWEFRRTLKRHGAKEGDVDVVVVTALLSFIVALAAAELFLLVRYTELLASDNPLSDLLRLVVVLALTVLPWVLYLRLRVWNSNLARKRRREEIHAEQVHQEMEQKASPRLRSVAKEGGEQE